MTVQLLISGCGGGGGGGLFGSFFGGSSDTASILGLFAAGGTGGGDGIGSGVVESNFVQDGFGDGGAPPLEVAFVHHPEPGSLALFGMGLAGAAALGRRRGQKSSQPS